MDIDSMLTPVQLRVAMAALEVTRGTLAKAFGVLDSEVAALESAGGNGELAGSLRQYFEARGLRFRATSEGVGICYEGAWLIYRAPREEVESAVEKSVTC